MLQTVIRNAIEAAFNAKEFEEAIAKCIEQNIDYETLAEKVLENIEIEEYAQELVEAYAEKVALDILLPF